MEQTSQRLRIRKPESTGSAAARQAAQLLLTSRIWLGVGILLLIMNGMIAAWSFQEIDSADYWVTHTHEVIEESEHLEFDLRSADAIVRAEILRPSSTARPAFDAAVREVLQHFVSLKSMTGDNASQQKILTALEPQLHQRISDLTDIMELREKSGMGPAEALREKNQDKGLSGQLQTATTSIETEERHLLAQREQERRKRQDDALVGMALSSALLLIALLVGPLAVNASTKRLMAADRALEASEEELRRLAGRLLTSQEDERRRIARNLHDDLSQSLAYLSMDLGRLAEKAGDPGLPERLLRLKKKAADTANLARTISHDLHASTLEDLGLAAALEESCQEFEERTGIVTRAEFRNIGEDINTDVASCVYLIVGEALRNVGKHSSASKATVSLAADDSGLRGMVSDDGVGIAGKTPQGPSGIGMTTMRERLYLVGGMISIRRGKERGTVVDFFIPAGEKLPS